MPRCLGCSPDNPALLAGEFALPGNYSRPVKQDYLSLSASMGKLRQEVDNRADHFHMIILIKCKRANLSKVDEIVVGNGVLDQIGQGMDI